MVRARDSPEPTPPAGTTRTPVRRTLVHPNHARLCARLRILASTSSQTPRTTGLSYKGPSTSQPEEEQPPAGAREDRDNPTRSGRLRRHASPGRHPRALVPGRPFHCRPFHPHDTPCTGLRRQNPGKKGPRDHEYAASTDGRGGNVWGTSLKRKKKVQWRYPRLAAPIPDLILPYQSNLIYFSAVPLPRFNLSGEIR